LQTLSKQQCQCRRSFRTESVLVPQQISFKVVQTCSGSEQKLPTQSNHSSENRHNGLFLCLEAKFYDYSEDNQNFSLPQLKVINFQTQYSDTWSEIYRLLTMYPGIELLEVRWDEVAHLYLKTNIGKVYLGSDRSLLAQQFQVLARFPELSTQENLSGVEYLDLTNPKIPFIQTYTEVK